MNNLEIFFYLKNSEIEIVIFDKTKKNIILDKRIEINLNFNEIENLKNKINDILKNLIIEIESKIKHSINHINLIIEDKNTLEINASIKKNFDKSKISKDQIEYVVQDLKQQVSKNSDNIKINHILIKQFYINGQKIDYLPINKVCDDLIIHLQFICFSKDLINSLENLFKNHQVEFSSILCANYTKSFISNGINNIFDSAVAIKEGLNPNEVLVIPKKPLKMGFFERLFQIIS